MQIISTVHFATELQQRVLERRADGLRRRRRPDLPAALRRPRRRRPRADPRRHRVHLGPHLRERVRRAQRVLQRHDGQHRSSSTPTQRPAATRAVEPGLAIGEDIYLARRRRPASATWRIPREDDDPDHYSERFQGGEDNGGVHSNSGIPNHVYYLAVNGGQNAGCDAVGSNGHRTRPTATRPSRLSGWTRPRRSSTPASPACRVRQLLRRPQRHGRGGRQGPRQHRRRVGRRRRLDGCTPAVPPPPPCTGGPYARRPSSRRRTPTATTVTAPGPTPAPRRLLQLRLRHSEKDSTTSTSRTPAASRSLSTPGPTGAR